jgi:hypothetical protein
MDRHCSHCGFPVAEQLRCPLCSTSMVRVNLRRTVLWALVAGEYLVALVILVRFL